jgi:hypothetical protein
VGGIPNYLHNWQADNDGVSIRSILVFGHYLSTGNQGVALRRYGSHRTPFPEISLPELLYVRLRTRSIAVFNRPACRCLIRKVVRAGRSNHSLRHGELHTSFFFYCYRSGIATRQTRVARLGTSSLHTHSATTTRWEWGLHQLQNRYPTSGRRPCNTKRLVVSLREIEVI